MSRMVTQARHDRARALRELWIVTLAGLFLGLMLAHSFFRAITRPVNAFADTLWRVVREGNFSQRIALSVRDTLNQLGPALNQMFQMAEDQFWLKSNTAHFSPIIQKTRTSEDFASQLIQKLTPLLGGGYGAIYILDKTEEKYRFLGGYACKKSHDPNQMFALGEGLIGQCAQEKEAILLTKVPDNYYLKITSGLGDALPRHILIVPLMFQDKVLGVIEIASFHPFTPIKQALMDELAPTFGLGLENLNRTKHTEDLLQKTKIMAEELKSQAEYTESIIYSMTDILVVVSPDGSIESINHPERFGYDKHVLIGQSIGVLFVEGDRLMGATLTEMMNQGSIHNVDATLVGTDGQTIAVLITGSVMRDTSGNILGGILVAKDITEYKRVQEELRTKDAQLLHAHAGRLTALEEMATLITHELNQPLTIARMEAENLQEEAEMGIMNQDSQIETTTTIMEQIDRASTIIQHMLAFSQGDKQEGAKEIDLSVPFHAASSLFHEQFRVHGISFITNLGQALPTIELSANRFEQIMVNLLSNARDALDKKGASDSHVTKEIELKLFHDLEQKAITLEVADNGVGMTPEVQNQCMEPFFTTKTESQGAGMGLHTVRGIVEEAKGSLEIESKLGEGSLFQVRLPVAT